MSGSARQRSDADVELTTRSASELAALVRARKLTATELLAATLRRLKEVNPRLNAVVTINEQAHEDARALDERLAGGEDVGPLAGLPVGIKDVTPVANVRTTFGSPLYADYVPDEDAEVVRRFRAAGAVILGKTNTPEFATGGNTFNEVFGRTRNPWDLGRSAGGSTGGGAAALAAGLIALAEGTDLGGSLRIPASFCGIVGLRPSPGLVPTHPSEFAWDTLQVTGPMARTVEDVALALQCISGPSERAPLAQPVHGRDFVAAARSVIPRGLRVAYSADVAGIGVDEGIARACQGAALSLSDAGATVHELAFDLAFARPAFLALRGHWMVAQQFARIPLIERMGTNLAGNIRSGLQLTVESLGEAEQVRGRVWELFRDFFSRHDCLLTPCMAVAPFPVEQNYPDAIAGRPMATYVDWLAPTFVLSLTGLPIASVPCGLDAQGLPIGLQIIGPPRGEERVLAVAAAVQRNCGIGLPVV
ncbi:MAG: amidase [Gemmatimonadaceae bacterium]